MRAKSLLGLLSIALVLCACKKDLEPQVASETSATPSTPQAPVQDAPVAQMTPAAPGQNAPTTTMTPAQMTPAQPAKVAPGMNPAHGQPGHRCDIAVGAPLSSPPGKTPAQPAMTINPSQPNQSVKMTPTASGTPALLQPTASATPAATAPGMNPAHGQPGHRCDIAVGAPLNSPPGNTPAAVKTEPAKADPNKLQITTSEPGK